MATHFTFIYCLSSAFSSWQCFHPWLFICTSFLLYHFGAHTLSPMCYTNLKFLFMKNTITKFLVTINFFSRTKLPLDLKHSQKIPSCRHRGKAYVTKISTTEIDSVNYLHSSQILKLSRQIVEYCID